MSLRSHTKVLVEKWFNTTSFQGPGEFSEEPGKVWRIYWTLVTIAMIICLLLTLYPLMTSYYNGQYSTTTTKQAVVTDSKWVKKFEKFLYCTDNWINITKVIERKIKEKMLLFALSLIQPDKGEPETTGALGHLLYRRLPTTESGEFHTLDNEPVWNKSRVRFPLRNRLIVGDSLKPRNLIEFQEMLTAENFLNLEQFLFSIANRYDQNEKSEAMSLQCKVLAENGPRLIHDGFLIRHGRVCQRLSLKQHIDHRVNAADHSTAASLNGYGAVFKFCLLHNRTNFYTGVNGHFNPTHFKPKRQLSFFTGIVDGIAAVEFPIIDKATEVPLDVIEAASLVTEYALKLSASKLLDKRGARCTNIDDGTTFPAFVDFKSYCDRICVNLAVSTKPVCSDGSRCQNCTFFYSERASRKDRLPCQTYIDPKPDVHQFRLLVSEYEGCIEECKEKCTTVNFDVEELTIPLYLPNSERCDSFSVWFKPTSDVWRPFLECAGYYEDIVTLKITMTYNLNQEIALHSLDNLFGQIGGNLGIDWYCTFNWTIGCRGQERLKCRQSKFACNNCISVAGVNKS